MSLLSRVTRHMVVVGILILCVIVIILGVVLVRNSPRKAYILPGDIQPYHYDLTVLYDIDPNTNFSYYGNVDILIKCVRPTKEVVLHGQGFELYEEKIAVKNGNNHIGVNKASLNDLNNFLTLYLDKSLEADKNYTLTIPFYGNLESSLDGVYISSYKNKDGTKEYLLATQFEEISARKGLPCFDEPKYKATFNVTVGHETIFIAASNMPRQKFIHFNPLERFWKWEEMEKKLEKPQKIFVWTNFENSKPMSTYLLAFVVSKFYYTQNEVPGRSLKFGIGVRSEVKNQINYAYEIGPKLLTYFEHWFNISYPLPKLDMFAIPDFSAGAMENWGLITYRETALLYDDENFPLTAKETVALTIAHEISHQWFGDLVTMKWWSDLWLNEGFATYMESLGVNSIHPEWQHVDYDALDNMRRVLELDGLNSSHPVSVKTENSNSIQETFDEISYNKGAFLIRVMVKFLGEDVFKRGITRYLNKYSYKNAEQDDLWEELTLAANETDKLPLNTSVKTIMDSWTKQSGYPLLTVTRDYDNRQIEVKQKRFLTLMTPINTSESWWVPLRIRTENDNRMGILQRPIIWMPNINNTIKFKTVPDMILNENEWILLNDDLVALCRVNYDKKNWQLLAAALNSSQYVDIPILSRAQLLSDAFALAWSDVLDYETAIRIVNYLGREKALIPMETGLEALKKIDRMLLRTSDYGAFQGFMRKLITEPYQQFEELHMMSTHKTDLMNVKMQVLLTKWACRVNVSGCETTALNIFNKWMSGNDPGHDNSIALELRSTVYCVAIRSGGVPEWRFLLDHYKRTRVVAERAAAMLALACTKEEQLLKEYLKMAIDNGTDTRLQDAASVFTEMARQPGGFNVTRAFLYSEIGLISKAFNGQGHHLGRIIKAIARQFTTKEELDEFKQWCEKNEKYLKETRLAISQAIEKAKVNIAWLERHRQAVVELLKQNS